MAELPVVIDLVIADADTASANVLKVLFESIEGVGGVAIARTAEAARDIFTAGQANALVVDLYSLGVSSGVSLIGWLREQYPGLPICHYADADRLSEFPGVPNNWRARFLDHYYKIAKDQPPAVLGVEARRLAYHMSTYLLGRAARVRLTQLRRRIEDVPGLPIELAREAAETVNVAEQALSARDTSVWDGNLALPGLPSADAASLVKDTFVETRRQRHIAVLTNTGVLAGGGVLVLGAFIVAASTGHWEAWAFGGLGMSGVIAALITNPLRTLGSGDARLVRVQTVYLTFLAQLGIHLNESKRAGGDALKAGERLGVEMMRCIAALEAGIGNASSEG